MVKFTFTSESVSEGHPDKVCDAISDAILDEYLKQDPNSRVACETLATTGTVFVSGEITSTATVDVESTVKKTLGDIGYNDSAYGMDYKNVNIGEIAFAIGHPGDLIWSFNNGMVSQLRKGYKWKYKNSRHFADVIQIQVPINPGNSGGPLFNKNKKLIGVNTFTAEGENLNFAISCLLYTSPSPRDATLSRMPSSA